MGLYREILFGIELSAEMFIRELLHMCEKTMVDDFRDVFALNSALIYTLDVFSKGIPKGSSFSTLIERQIIIISEKNNNPDESESSFSSQT